ncbi:hypothetical protein EGW08_009034 [Elysia chlorotica]|uniref:Uncharacterized protein n=1 Tax=Elysia chlorotica TaxID=188477 RepID=A0A3S1C557_ELYCH|nr:hypothetical protein EGW08_009034 [Elysia chlorotica]
MARPGPSYQIGHNNTSSYNLISNDRYGVPESPLYGGYSPRREVNFRPKTEENIEAIRDQEIKLMRGIVKPTAVKNDNRSSYDLISGVPKRRVDNDPDFERIRQREMAMAAGYPQGVTPPPGSPIKAHRHVPDSPLYRPAPGHNQSYGRGQGYGKGQGYSPRDDPRDDPRQMREQSPQRPGSYGKDANIPPHQSNAMEDSSGYPAQQHQQQQQPPPEEMPPEARSPVVRLADPPMPSTPEFYRPGQGKGLTMADPRTGSALKGRMPWDEPNMARPTFPPTPDYNTTKLHIGQSYDDDTSIKLQGLHRGRDDFKALDEFRDHRGNTLIKGFPPDSYRSGYGLSSDRGHAKAKQRERDFHAGRDMYDPRYGGAISTGPGLMGTRNGGALLFIKFPVGRGENIRVASHAFLRAKTLDCGGRYLGMAGRVYEFGYENGPQEAIAVFHFPNQEKALLFFQTDSVIRQPDFPPPYGHAEMWIVCNAYLPDNMPLFNTFLLSEVQLHQGKERREFFETFQVPFENYLYKNGAMPFVICSYGSRDRQDIRRHCYLHNSIVTCHLFQGLDHLNWITNDETYSKFRSLHNQMATERCSIFKLSRDTGL